MAVQIFNLRGVPDDEADEIRALLTEHKIDYYETPAGNWGMSMPALWLKDENQLEQAKTLLAEYGQQRFSHAQAEYDELKSQGKQRTIVDIIREQPLRYLLYLILIGVILYFSVSPFLKLAK